MEKKTGIKFCLAALFFLFLYGCGAEREDAPLYSSPGEADKEMRDFVLTEIKGENKEWELEAEEAVLVRERGIDIIRVNSYKMNFFEEDSAVSALYGARGEFNRLTEVFFARESVEIVSRDRKIITSDVKWNPADEVFTTEEEVEVYTPGGVVRGKGMEASRDLSEINIKERISGRIREREVDEN